MTFHTLPIIHILKTYHSSTIRPRTPKQIVHVIHPFSPLRQKEFEFVERTRVGNVDRVLCFDEDGNYRYLPVEMTDCIPPDAFTTASEGKARISDTKLIELASYLEMLATKSVN